MTKNKNITYSSRNVTRHVPHKFLIYGVLGLILSSLANQVVTCSQVGAVANAENTVGDVFFSGSGHYGFATAGNNNAYRGESYETMNTTGHLITPEQNSNLPSNWESIKHQIETTGEWGNPTVTNLSGSKLELNGGKVQYARYSGFSCNEGEKGVILINPKGEYIMVDKKPEYVRDVTQFVNSGGEGWYFAFYPEITIESCAQAAWSITTVYEKPDLPLSNVELVSSWIWIDGDESTEGRRDEYMMFERPILPNREVELLGVYIGAGGRSWEINGVSEDETYAVFTDNSEQQLYSMNYNGRTIFASRTNTDFANGTFNTIRSHTYKGGELDIFDEALNSSFFGGRTLAGYHFIKTGSDYINPAIIGYREVVAEPQTNDEPEPTQNKDNTPQNKDVTPGQNSKSSDISVPDTGSFTNNFDYITPFSISLAGLALGSVVAWLTRRKATSKHIAFAKK